jgi:hypothetical protein
MTGASKAPLINLPALVAQYNEIQTPVYASTEDQYYEQL